MKTLLSQMNALMEYSLNEADWKNHENRMKIESAFKSLLDASHQIPPHPQSPNEEDPAISILGPFLSEQIQTTLSAFQLGQFEFSRKSTRSITRTCFTCHSKEPLPLLNADPSFSTLIQKLPPLEQARYHVTTHQIDAALKIYETLLFNPELIKSDFLTWDHARLECLTLLLRVKRDPNAALQLIQRIKSLSSTPKYIQRELVEWGNDLSQWEKTKTVSSNSTSQMKMIRDLFRAAMKRRTFPFDHSADMSFLRLTSILFEFMRKNPKSNDLPEVHYMQGVAHETLGTPPFENLHEIFYESCIKNRPHSELSLKCYELFERSIYLGYTGSAGTHIPGSVQNKLLELWGTALVPHTDRR